MSLTLSESLTVSSRLPHDIQTLILIYYFLSSDSSYLLSLFLPFPHLFPTYLLSLFHYLCFFSVVSENYFSNLSSLSLYNFGFIFDVRELAPSLLADIALFQSIVGKKARSLLIFIFAILLYKNRHLSKLLYKIFSIIL